jgi:hypothetical protein
MPSFKTKCSFCNESFIDKTFSKHLLNKHIDKLFSDIKNQHALERATRADKSWLIKPVEINFTTDNDETESLYYIPCCSKFFKKEDMAKNHIIKNPECREAFMTNAKETYKTIVNNITNNINTVTINGNNNTITQNTYNIDLSGNSIAVEPFKQIIRNMAVTIDAANRQRAEYYKKYMKLKKQLNDSNMSVDSDISNVDSYYSGSEFGYQSDTDNEKYLERYDVSKDNKQIIKKHNISIDISNKALKLKTPEDKLKKLEKKKEEQRLQDAFDEQVRQGEIKENIINMKSEIKSLQEKIVHNNKELKYLKSQLTVEESGMTQELYEKECIKYHTKNNKCSELISELNKKIKELTNT